MKQSSLGLSNPVKRTRKRESLDTLELVVPWAELVALIKPYAPESGRRASSPLPYTRCRASTSCSHGSSAASRR